MKDPYPEYTYPYHYRTPASAPTTTQARFKRIQAKTGATEDDQPGAIFPVSLFLFQSYPILPRRSALRELLLRPVPISHLFSCGHHPIPFQI